MPRKVKINIIFLCLIVLAVASCGNHNIYFQYHAVDPEAWSKDSLYSFAVDVKDASLSYNVYIQVRNSPNYPNQNLWLFLSEISPDSVQVNDTIEFYLADHRGKWLGTGVGAVKEMPVLYKQNIRFDRAGVYTYLIGHGMRTDDLKGITEIGMRVEELKTTP